MRRLLFHPVGLCVLFATLCSGCIFVNDECDYIETQCWDVVDVYCDAWSCWETVHTECEDYCVDVADPVAPPECTQDYHCSGNAVCQDQRCVSPPQDRASAGLCEECEVNADCTEAGALCLNLTEDATIGHCGRSCETGSCPVGFECVTLGGQGRQCVPESRSCSGTSVPPPDDPECDADNPCAAPQRCQEGVCVDPEPDPECDAENPCADPQICDSGECVDPEPECGDNDDCGTDEECIDGACYDIEVASCERSSECGETGICVDGSCRETCESTDDCPGNQVCRAGLCSPPPEPECVTGLDCSDVEGEYYCVNGMCRASCESSDECDFGYLCRGFYCDVDPAVECRSTLECGLDQDCVEGECLTRCAASCNCPAGLTCDETDDYCRDLPIPESCTTDCDCPGGYECSQDDVCVEL